jgi:predicted DCC family thiol-disulfide oxidoreductase YuxK
MFRFAPLQSSFASGVLRRHGVDPRKLDTIYIMLDYNQPTERLLSKSEAILFTLPRMEGPWRVFSTFRVPPKTIRHVGYDLVAHNRYRIFGRYETCLAPQEK